MEILAGVFCGRGVEPASPSLKDALTRHVSRRNADTRRVFERSGLFLVAVGDTSRRGHLFEDLSANTLSVVLGDPLVVITKPDRLSAQAREEGGSLTAWLERSTGTFCGVAFDGNTGTLFLFTDKLGVRPLYYARTSSGLVVFSSALRVLERAPGLSRPLDLRGVLELAAFDYPLAWRTPYLGVRMLGAAEVVRVNRRQLQSRQYWAWDRVSPSGEPLETLASKMHAAFESAIERRLPDQTRTQVAFLSGGLDSRCVVATLRARRLPVDTVNVGVQRSADRVFGAMVASQLGTTHKEVEFATDARPHWGKIAASALSSEDNDGRWLEMWSGDGGSVGTGHVYCSPAVVELMRRGAHAEAVEAYCTEWGLDFARAVLRSEVRRQTATLLTDGIQAELRRFQCVDPGRAFYLFLMQNDQRRHLSSFYEDIDIHRVNYLLPFYDASIIELVMSVPLDECLQHRFYYRWLRKFEDAVWNTPWQVYRGHEPCPVPSPEPVTRQWDLPIAASWQHREATRVLRSALVDRDLPKAILSRTTIGLLRLHQLAGGRRYSYASGTVAAVLNHWTMSDRVAILTDVSGEIRHLSLGG